MNRIALLSASLLLACAPAPLQAQSQSASFIEPMGAITWGGGPASSPSFEAQVIGGNWPVDGGTSSTYVAKSGVLGATAGGEPITAGPMGTPFSWLDGYGLVTGAITYAQAELGDTDEDGQMAYEEFIAGTNPTNPASRFAFTDAWPATPGGDHVVEWHSVSGRVYSLQARNDLEAGTWTNVPGAVDLPAKPPQNIFTNPPGSPVQFYRGNVKYPR